MGVNPFPLRVPDPPPGAEPFAWGALAVGTVLALLLLRWLRGRRGSPFPAWLSVLLALVAAAGVLSGAELAVRGYEARYGTSPWVQAETLHWLLAPNLENAFVGPMGRHTFVTTNSLGLREPAEPPTGRQPGELRILALGDSWTLGVEMRPDQTWAKQLQARLQARHPQGPVTVVNGGQNGFSYLQGYYMAKYLVPIYQPDLVLVGGFIPVSESEMEALEALESVDPRVDEVMRTLNRSRLYRILRSRFAERVTGRPEHMDELQHVFSGSVRYAKALACYLEAQGIPAVFFHHAFAKGDAQWYSEPVQPILKDLPRDLPGVAAVDILPGWDAAGKGLLLEHDPTHPNAQGYEAMAEALDRYLASPEAPAPLAR